MSPVLTLVALVAGAGLLLAAGGGSCDEPVEILSSLAINGSRYGWPLAGPIVVTSTYGWRVRNGKDEFHPGVDFHAVEATPVYAVEAGVVVGVDVAGVGNGRFNGNAVSVRGDSGVFWHYLHFSRMSCRVGPRVRVARGQRLGWSGHTGLADAPHLHLQASVLVTGADGRRRAQTVDPLDLFPIPRRVT
jgi:murein DD-endopeptidase MepM/ murein hydrolase activator NlpD